MLTRRDWWRGAVVVALVVIALASPVALALLIAALSRTLIGQVVLVAIAAVAALTLAGAAGLRRIGNTIRGAIMSQQETIDALAVKVDDFRVAAAAKIDKVRAEILAAINSPDGVDTAALAKSVDQLDAISSALQGLDDIVPDAEEPVDPDFGVGGSGAVTLPDDVPVPE